MFEIPKPTGKGIGKDDMKNNMKKKKEKKTRKCSCGTRFRLHDWMEKREKEACFTCRFIYSNIEIMARSLNHLLKDTGKKGRITIYWDKRGNINIF